MFNKGDEIVIKVRRGHVVEDGFKYLGGLSSVRIKGKIFVKFVNEMGIVEEGIDQGGPFKEFMTQLIAEAFDPSYGLFSLTPDSSYVYPSSSNSNNKSRLSNIYRFLGCMMARSIQEGILVDIQFARFFLSKLSGRGVFLEDLAGLNDELLKNLMFLKKYDGDVEDLCLYFSVDEEIDNQIVSKDLKYNGSHIKVTNDNRIQYIHLMADYKLNQQTKEQTESFINGFQSIIPKNWLRMFSPPELQRVISGDDDDWDVADLRKYTEYQEGYFDQHSCIKNFWSILDDFQSKDRKAFLKFVTSCSKPPLGGFKFLVPKFTICKVSTDLEPGSSSTSNSNNLSSNLRQVTSLFSSVSSNLKSSTAASKARLPTSSTCFNLIRLPAYSSKSIMKEKLKYAIRSNTGFELA